jgi:Transposase
MKNKAKTKKEGHGPSLIDIRDRWFRDVPDVELAYWLKEDFSDILQLWDRQKAEALMDLWLHRVEEFVKDFSAKYHAGRVAAWRGPFSNVLSTFKTWRPYILNYIDCKNRFALTMTNFFAEHVNKKIKAAKALGSGTSFEMLRMKVIYGGVMVRHRPPHPMRRKTDASQG